MLTVDDILASVKKAPSKPDEAAQRQLPYKKAFILGRQSSQGQVRDHKEALLEIAALVDVAKNDGYQTCIVREEVEFVLLAIRDGRADKDILQDGDVIVDLRDLGLSASRDPEKRQGLIAFRTRTEAGEIGCLYVTDTSRITRDPTRIEPYQLIQLMIDHHCRVRTPEGIWNPAIDRDWEYLTAELEDAGKESKKLRRILHRKKMQKASRGEWVGNAVPAGFYLPMEGKQPSGKYMFKKYALHEPHAAVATRILEEFNRHEGSPHATLKALHNQEPTPTGIPLLPIRLGVYGIKIRIEVLPQNGYWIPDHTGSNQGACHQPGNDRNIYIWRYGPNTE